MTTVDFIPFANDASSANVVTQSDYLAAASGSGYVQNGFSSGTAASNQVNKAIRQSSVMTAAFAQFLAAKLSASVLDSGGAASVTAIQAQIAAAAASAALTSGTIGSGVALAVFPAGTKMLFIQTAAPTGWTKDTTHNDKMLRIVSGTASSGGSTGISTAWTSVALSGAVTAHTLTSAEIPSHTHSGTTGGQSATHHHSINMTEQGGLDVRALWGTSLANGTLSTGDASGDHTHTITTDGGTGGGGSHTHGLTVNAFTVSPLYVDAIICTKS